MREEPDIVKILREEENSRLTSNMHSIFKHQEVIEEEPEDIKNAELDFPEEYNTFLDDSEGKNNENTSNDISDLLFEHTTNMMAYLSRTGKVLKVNKATLKFSGFTKEELEGRPFWKIPGAFKKKDIPEYLKIIKNVFQGKKIEGFKGELLDKSGDKHILNFSFYPIKQNNKVTQILLVGEDATKFDQTEKQLLETEETYKNIIENSPDSIGIIDNKGVFTHWNTAAEKIYGFSKEEIVGKHFTNTKLLNKKDIPKYIKLFLSIKTGKETKPFETEIIHKDGRKITAELYYSLIKKDEEKIGIQAITRDITERKKIEKELAESNERYKSIFERSRDWVYIHDFKGNFLDANQAALDGLGYKKDEIKSTNFSKILPKSELLRAVKDTISLKRRGYDITPAVYKVKRKDGAEIFVETLSTVLYENGKPYAVQGIARDITDRKNYEEELKKSEEKFRSIVENIGECVWEVDKNGIYTYISPRVEHLLGYSPSEILGKTPFDLMPKSEAEQLQEKFLEIIKSKKPFKGLENINIHKDGHEIILETNGVPILDENENLLGYRGMDRDVTSHKKWEESLRESEERYRTMFESANDGIIIIEKKGGITDINKTASELFGRPREEYIGKNLKEVMHLFTKKSQVKILKNFAVRMLGKQVLPYEVEMFTANGGLKTVEINAVPFKKDGEVIGDLAILRDVTFRRKAEEELRNNEEKLRTVLETVREGITFSDKTGKFEIFNIEMERLTGYTHDEANKCSDFSKLIYPTDASREKALEALTKLTKPGNIHEAETRIITKKGKTKDMLVSTVIVPYNGKEMFLSAYRDITDRKKAEEEMKESEERYRALFESINDGVIIADVKTKQFKYVNPAICEMLGYNEEELTKMKMENIHPDYYHSEAYNGFENHAHGSKHIVENTPLVKKNGSIVYADVGATAITIKGEKFNVGIFRDVTERLKKETELLKFSRAMQQSQTSVIITDDKGTIEYINPKFEEVSSYRKAELIGKNTNILKSGKNPKETYETLWKTISSGDTWKGELLNKKKNGELYWENVIITPIKNAEGKITNFVASKEDITQRKKMVEDLKIKDYAISSSINAIAITNSVGNITYVNPAFLKMWGYIDDKDVVGKPLIKFWQMKGNYMKVMDAMVNQGGWVGELTAEKADGASFPVQLSANLVKDERKEIKYMMASFVDITKQKQAEEELLKNQKRIEEQNIKLKKLDELKSTFLNVTSHELRTPMASIKGYVQMVMKQTLGQTSDEQNKALNVVLRNVDRLDHLIQDILDISRLESGTMKFIPEDTNIAEIINEIAETMQSSANAKQIKIKTEINGKIPNLTVDQDRIKQVIINFINNAIKFSEPNTEITIRTCKQEKDILIEVQDFGRGIPSDKLTKVFDTFYQVDSGMDRKFGGAGLGLSISRGIVLAHGGKIWAESQEKKGSTFKFTLPLKPVKNLEDNFRDVDVFRLKEDEIKEEYEKYKNRMKI